jgi:hypothetical protein
VTANATASAGATPYNIEASNFVNIRAAAAPMQMPNNVTLMPWPAINSKDISATGSEGHTNSNLHRSLPHRVRHQAVETHGRQQQTNSTEYR